MHTISPKRYQTKRRWRGCQRRQPTTSWFAAVILRDELALLPPHSFVWCTRPRPLRRCTCIAPACCTRINITHYHKKLTRLEAGFAPCSRDASLRRRSFLPLFASVLRISVGHRAVTHRFNSICHKINFLRISPIS